MTMQTSDQTAKRFIKLSKKQQQSLVRKWDQDILYLTLCRERCMKNIRAKNESRTRKSNRSNIDDSFISNG